MNVQIAWETPNQPEIVALIEELDRYQAELYPAESNHLLDISRLMEPNVLFCVARVDGVTMGCGAAVLYNAVLYNNDYAEIKRMFVSPASRGAGLGWRILAFVETELGARDVAMARLETGIHQVEAIRLYERSGYVTIPPFGDYREDPLSRFYEKRLGDHG